ncbi:hypothetical protein L7F22_039324 [Adiantum nelumboides]|nr:hypothetical protein [Adiantum nelumboides]
MVIDIFAEDNKAAAANPYITLMLTFLSQECKTEGYLRKLEKFVPWESLVTLGNSIPSSVESIDPRNDATLKIRGDAIPLPEDWCLRGMAWVGRRVYERGFWKPHKIERLGLRNSLALFENELEMIDRCTRCTNGGEKDSDRKSQSESPHHNDEEDDDNDDDDDDDDEDSENHGIHGGDQSSRPRLTLTVLRWKRITHALTILIKTVPGMDFDIETGYVHARHGRMILAPPLSKKVIQWRADEARAEVEGAIGHLKLAALEGRTASPDQNEDAPRSAQISLKVEEDDDLDEDEVEVPSTAETGDISEEIKELTKRRNELRKQLQIGKSANHYRSKHTNSHDTTASRQQSSTKSKTSTQTSIRIVPGYTTLLLDTNVMLTPTDILSQLIKSKRWMVIIPLSVVTELDGLKRREGDVGKRAQDAIKFLETKVKTHSTNFKVQTSRGNYLTDLRFRTEDIDFTANKQFEGENEDSLPEAQTQNDSSEGNEDGKFAMARSVDDVILRCLSWQSGAHFRNRLLLLCSNDEERAKREAEIAKKIVPSVARAVLVTLDRNLRIKARFRSLSAIGLLN